MTNQNYAKNTIVPGDEKIHFESRPEFGLEKKVEEEKKKRDNKDEKEDNTIKTSYLSNTVIKTNNRKEIHTLLQVLEYYGWRWLEGEKATDISIANGLNKIYMPGMCIEFNKQNEIIPYEHLAWGSEKFFQKNQYKIIQPDEYYTKHLKLNVEKLRKIKEQIQ